jgi:hypothetical protein
MDLLGVLYSFSQESKELRISVMNRFSSKFEILMIVHIVLICVMEACVPVDHKNMAVGTMIANAILSFLLLAILYQDLPYHSEQIMNLVGGVYLGIFMTQILGLIEDVCISLIFTPRSLILVIPSTRIFNSCL